VRKRPKVEKQTSRGDYKIPESIVGLDVGSHAVKLVELERNAGAYRLKSLDMASAHSFYLNEEVVEAVKKRENKRLESNFVSKEELKNNWGGREIEFIKRCFFMGLTIKFIPKLLVDMTYSNPHV